MAGKKSPPHIMGNIYICLSLSVVPTPTYMGFHIGIYFPSFVKLYYLQV